MQRHNAQMDKDLLMFKKWLSDINIAVENEGRRKKAEGEYNKAQEKLARISESDRETYERVSRYC
jgi:hypothetical protein